MSTAEVVKCSIDPCIWTEETKKGLPEIFLHLPQAETSSVAQFYFSLACIFSHRELKKADVLHIFPIYLHLHPSALSREVHYQDTAYSTSLTAR